MSVSLEVALACANGLSKHIEQDLVSHVSQFFWIEIRRVNDDNIQNRVRNAVDHSQFPLLEVNPESIPKYSRIMIRDYSPHVMDYIQHLQIHSLDISSLYYDFTDENISDLPKGVQHLNLAWLRINDDGLTVLFQNQKQLKTLDISNINLITSQGIRHLPQSVTDLKIAWCKQISGDGLTLLHSNCSLEKLDLTGCEVNDVSITHLSNFSLKELDISFCDNITHRAIQALPKSLKKLSLTDCGDNSNHGIKFVPRTLAFLKISWWIFLKSEFYPSGTPCFRRLVHLTELRLSECSGFKSLEKGTPAQLRFFQELCPNLQYLYLLSCDFPSGCLSYLPTSLKHFELSWCSSMKNSNLPYLPKGLQTMEFSYCDEISDEGFLSQTWENVKIMKFSRCQFISTDGMKPLSRKYPGLEISVKEHHR